MLFRILDLTRWPVVLVVIGAGFCAAALAFVSFNLFQVAMANAAFLARYGWLAVMEGALWQLATLVLSGTFALFCYFGFKLCENELVQRYRLWTIRRRSTDPE